MSQPSRPSSAAFTRLLGLAILALALLAAPLLADIIHLKNGGRIEGRIIKQTPTEVHVRTKFGTVMKLKPAQIKRIEKKRDIWDDYERERNKVKNNDADGLFALYQWCKQNGMKHEAARVLDEVLQANPDHPAVHQMRGEVNIAGKWMKPEQAKAAGYRLHEGKWLTHDAFMKATGHVRWGSKWITEAEYDRLKIKTEMESLLNMELTVENSAHFGVRTRFPKEHALEILRLCEVAYDEFMKVLPYPKDSLKRWKRIQIYLFADLEEFQLFFDRFIWPKRYVTKEHHYEYYREAGNCNFYFPHPIIVLRRSPALPKFKDQCALIVHNVGHVMLHRMKKSIYPPDWLEEGLGHYLEQKVFGHARIFCLWPGRLSTKELIVPGWRNTADWKKKANRLLVPGEVPPWKTLMMKPLGGMTTKELAKVHFVLLMIIEEKPKALRAFLDTATEHSWVKVFAEAVGWSPEEVDRQLERYLKEKF